MKNTDNVINLDDYRRRKKDLEYLNEEEYNLITDIFDMEEIDTDQSYWRSFYDKD